MCKELKDCSNELFKGLWCQSQLRATECLEFCEPIIAVFDFARRERVRDLVYGHEKKDLRKDLDDRL